MIVCRTNSNDQGFQDLIQQLDKDLWDRYPHIQATYDKHNKIDFIETVIVVYEGNTPMGCGCFKKFDETSVEIKRMFVADSHRGKGIGVTILSALEAWAKELGFSSTVLERGKKQPEASKLYQKCGYLTIENYGPYVGMSESVCMKKNL